jgi:hypothetical protein
LHRVYFFALSPISTSRRMLGRPFRLTLELNVALLRDRSLLNRYQLAFHLTELGRRLLVSANQERRRSENDHSAVVATASLVC